MPQINKITAFHLHHFIAWLFENNPKIGIVRLIKLNAAITQASIQKKRPAKPMEKNYSVIPHELGILLFFILPFLCNLYRGNIATQSRSITSTYIQWTQPRIMFQRNATPFKIKSPYRKCTFILSINQSWLENAYAAWLFSLYFF